MTPGRRLFGTQMGGGGASIYFDIGSDISEEQLHGDWMAPHEMLHLGQPGLARKHLWFQEGFATYAEPLARLEAGEISADEFWAGFVRGMPHGEQQAGDRGLDRTPTWGRTYWGGALFWLLADVEIRRLSHGRRSARDAARAVLDSVGNCTISAPIEDVLKAADHGVGHPVFLRLYERYARANANMGLESLWDKLGVHSGGAGLRYDDHAPLAWVRRAISVLPRAHPRAMLRTGCRRSRWLPLPVRTDTELDMPATRTPAGTSDRRHEKPFANQRSRELPSP
jgi:hypothetical protein